MAPTIAIILFFSLVSFESFCISLLIDARNPNLKYSLSTVSNSSKQAELHSGSSSFSLKISDVTVEYLHHHAGYYDLSSSLGARMFYFFFASQKDIKDPVVLWLSGGPGVSGCVALFYCNGPRYVNDDLSLKLNENGWDQVSHIIYVDQPIGTGSSYTTNSHDVRDSLDVVIGDLYCFIQSFFKDHPMLVENDFFIAGASYAGHYAPALATKLLEEKQTNEEFQINLKGIAIGNGMVNAMIQHPTMSFYAYHNNIITESEYLNIKENIVPSCERAAKTCNAHSSSSNDCLFAYNKCQIIVGYILSANKTVNPYDIRATRRSAASLSSYDFSNMEKLMNSKSIKEALKLPAKAFTSWNIDVYNALLADIVKNYDTKVATTLTRGINVLIYVGDQDIMCNVYGSINWVLNMEWYGKEDFNSYMPRPFYFGKKRVGVIRKYGPLTFVKIHGAGHMVPMDQPEIALHMIRSWMQSCKKK